jgi:hypothetical protein
MKTAIIRSCLRNLGGCNIGITDWRDLRVTLLRWARIKFHRNVFSHSKVTGLQSHRQQIARSYWDQQQWTRRGCKLGNIISRRTEGNKIRKNTEKQIMKASQSTDMG